MDILKDLNPAQREAVQAIEGPVLVLAGPGSGKTRVLTHRVAYLVRECDVDPYHVMAVTFTNKAAQEMKVRLDHLLGQRLRRLTIGTFHAICSRTLRREAKHLDVSSDFVIYDRSDQLGLVRQALKDLNLDDKMYRPQAMLGTISRAKNELIAPESFAPQTYWQEVAGRVYTRYQELLLANNAQDFDDLLMNTVHLFTRHPDVLAKYQRRYLHILVDEFQDTNTAQYALVKRLAGKRRNLFVVGDEDQCLPPGTLVRVPTGAASIETLREGDQVSACSGRGQHMPARISVVRRRPYAGKMVEIRTRSGQVIRATPNHIMFARLGAPSTVHYVYLMYREDKGYRIGIAVGARSDGVRPELIGGLKVRGNQEDADRIWVLRVCDSREEACYYEQFYAYEYGIPTMVFHVWGRRMRISQQAIDRLYQEIDTRSRAERLMADLHINKDFPHYLPKAKVPQRRVVNFSLFGDSRRSAQSPWNAHRISLNSSDERLSRQLEEQGYYVRAGRRSTWRIETCRLHFADAWKLAQSVAEAGGGLEIVVGAFITDVEGRSSRKYQLHPASHIHPTMVVPVWSDDGEIVNDVVTEVNWPDYEGEVYDLDVESLHNYVANGIVVHNSIYAFRGADFRNVHRFRRDYPDARVVLLEQNYRSTQTILDVAKTVISHNVHRTPKNLRTEKGRGLPIVVHEAYNEQEEAQYVLDQIALSVAGGTCRPGDCAIMYRTNAQSRVLEDAFVRAGLPYKLVGATRFYARREIKDVLAYLRLVHNPRDSVSLARIINVPARGIGAKTRSSLETWAADLEAPIHTALQMLKDESAGGAAPFSTRARKVLVGFADLLDELITAREKMNVLELLDLILDKSGYSAYIRDGTEEGEDRWNNILELRTVAREYLELPPETSLTTFLEEVALVSEVDNLDETANAPTLLTLHMAKGLEFPVVFIVGLEDGLFPHSRSFDDPEGMEEERRLCYVGITRAKERVYLVHAFRRTMYGESQVGEPSRFIEDIPDHLIAGRGEVLNEEERPYRFQVQRPVTSAPAMTGQFETGDRVRHRIFGEGIVVESKVAGTDEEVTVAFEEKGIKRLLASFAKLEKLEG